MPINREIRFVTTGTDSSPSQVFFNNYLADSIPVQASFYSFNKPLFYTYGGTLNYYSQDPYSIYTNLVRPPIRFVFSANTFSLSGDSYFVHEIYRLDYETYKLYSDNQLENSLDIQNKIETGEFGGAGRPSSLNAPSKEFIGNLNTLRGNNKIPQPEKLFGEPLTSRDLNTIQNYFRTPILTLTAATSGITGNIYDLYIEQYVKQPGQFKTDLFLDKSQYFIETKLFFKIELDKSYNSFTSLSPIGNSFISSNWNNTLQLSSTNSLPYTITTGPFAGLSVSGNYFTYFTVPDKPALEYPIMSGQLTTFTPEFRWSNGDYADSFLIQINYNSSDTGFTGTAVFNYPVEKTDKNTKVSRSRIKFPNSEFETEKAIYTYQIPIKSRKGFLYRIGNSKELIDIFDIRRNVITFSDYYSATTQTEPIRVYVKTETDSPFTPGISGFEEPPSLDFESPIEEFALSGIVTGSIVTGATIQLTYPNSSFTNTTTDLTGYYSFSGLETGVYTLTTNYRGYNQDVRVINITGNTSESFKMKLTWGNNVDTWGKMAGENYYT